MKISVHPSFKITANLIKMFLHRFVNDFEPNNAKISSNFDFKSFFFFFNIHPCHICLKNFLPKFHRIPFYSQLSRRKFSKSHRFIFRRDFFLPQWQNGAIIRNGGISHIFLLYKINMNVLVGSCTYYTVQMHYIYLYRNGLRLVFSFPRRIGALRLPIYR